MTLFYVYNYTENWILSPQKWAKSYKIGNYWVIMNLTWFIDDGIAKIYSESTIAIINSINYFWVLINEQFRQKKLLTQINSCYWHNFMGYVPHFQSKHENYRALREDLKISTYRVFFSPQKWVMSYSDSFNTYRKDFCIWSSNMSTNKCS